METSYFLGVDVSKDSFSSALKNGSFIFKDRIYKMNLRDFKALESEIRPFRENLLIGMEYTGIYHKNLFNFLVNKGYNVVEIDPYIMFRFFRFKNPKPTTTDNKSSKSICEFLEFNKERFYKDKTLIYDERYSLRYFVREKERITQDIAKTKTEIKRILSLVFKEILEGVSIFNERVLCFLLNFPSAESIRKLSKEDFREKTKTFFEEKRGRRAEFDPDKIYKLAENSISHNYPLYEELLKIKIRRLKSLIEEKEAISKVIFELIDRFFKREIEILTSIKGIGKESAIYFMAEVVDIKRFPNKRKLIGFFRFDPIIKQSGNYKASFRISKRGNSHIRRIAWIMAGCVKRTNPYFREYYLKKRQEAKSYKEAVIATSTKLLRTIYALLNENRCFK